MNIRLRHEITMISMQDWQRMYWGMLQLAEQLCHLYPMLDRDLLYSGVILHDVGKTVELSGAIVSEYTTQGKLLGHISIMQAEVLAKAKQLGLGGL